MPLAYLDVKLIGLLIRNLNSFAYYKLVLLIVYIDFKAGRFMRFCGDAISKV